MTLKFLDPDHPGPVKLCLIDYNAKLIKIDVDSVRKIHQGISSHSVYLIHTEDGILLQFGRKRDML